MAEPLNDDLSQNPVAIRKTLRRYQKAFAELVAQLKRRKRPAIIIFEGWGAAGKGDLIRLVTARLDPQLYAVSANHRPEGAEARHHYLWRYWRQFPERGRLAIFDRSWYRRVLTDRIEGNCSVEEWERAYQEINQIERQLVEFGALLVKFWLQISPDEQLRRFESRANDETRRWKISSEDWQRRDRWHEYQTAADNMLAGTTTVYAPWTVIDSDLKINAQLQTLQALYAIFSTELKYNPIKTAGKGRGRVKDRVEGKMGK